MNLPIQKLGHRKFLKNKDLNNFKVGYYLPEQISLDETRTLSLDCKNKKGQCTVFFVISSSCSACDLESIESFMKSYPLFLYIVFYESKENEFKELQKLFKSMASVYKCETLKLQRQLGFDLYPCALGINSVGQVVACGLFNDESYLRKVLSPLLMVVYNESL